MTHIVRYIVENHAPSARPAGASAAAVSGRECPQCNYSNNYYGDQVCRPRRG